MAYDKKPGNRKGGPGGYQKSGGGRPTAGRGYAPKQDAPRTEGGYKGPATGGYAKPAQGGKRPGYNRNDEAFDGASTRPQRPQSRSENFFGKSAPAPQGKPKPQGPGPRRAAPSARPVPPAVRDESPAPGREAHYPFRSNQGRAAPVGSDITPTHPVIPELMLPEADARENMLVGRNPIREAIKAGRAIEKLLVAEGELSGSARQIVAWAREARIVVQYVDRTRLDQIYPNHQGMIAFTAAAEYKSVEDILAYAKEKGEPPFVVVLDSITDPHNLGAIIRTAECAGAHGVIVPERRSAGLSPAAVKASAGATEYQRIAKVVNLTRTLQELKQEGLWVIGADMAGEPLAGVDLAGPIALVIGSEGEGISSLVQKQCDRLVSLPIKGHIESLNASVAAGVLMYEVLRARSE